LYRNCSPISSPFNDWIKIWVYDYKVKSLPLYPGEEFWGKKHLKKTKEDNSAAALLPTFVCYYYMA